MIVTVNVTQTDINEGLVGSCESCPISLAASRVIDPAIDHWTGVNHLHVKRAAHMSFVMPLEARLFRLRFDNRVSVRPFTFEMDLPEWAVKDSAK